MARPKSAKPSYCHHKASGHAYVTLDGKRTYLGRHGTPESGDAYDRVIGEWIARGRQPAAPTVPAAQPQAEVRSAAARTGSSGRRSGAGNLAELAK